MWRCLGLDLSLSNTGVAVLRDDKAVVHLESIRTTVKDGSHIVRDDIIAARIVQLYRLHQPSLIVIEDYAYGQRTYMSALGELGGIVRHELVAASGVPNCWVTFTSTACKKHTTGRGGASKQEMIAAMALYYPRPYVSLINDDNVADAMALARMGVDKHGASVVAGSA